MQVNCPKEYDDWLQSMYVLFGSNDVSNCMFLIFESIQTKAKAFESRGLL